MAAVTGYGRRAYGACAQVGSSSTYECSGINAATQTISHANATVFTDPGFQVTAGSGNGITITGNGALSYTDTNASPLTAPFGAALDVRSTGAYVATPGSVTIDTNGALSGGTYGIRGRNYGTGALTITANGDVTGTNVHGIFARNSGTDLSVTTGAGTTVHGANYGLLAVNSGTGALTVTANGNVTGTAYAGIYAGTFGTTLSVTTGTGTTVSGGGYGILARNYGTSTLAITANGNVTGTAYSGITAVNYGTTLSVTTGTGTTVSGGGAGITALNYGTGALTITANGNVTGTCACSSGIYAVNYGTALSVTTGAGTTVSGGSAGIIARNYGTGALTITANGNVYGTNNAAISALNTGTDLTVTTAVGTTVTGNTDGIYAHNLGTGALTITANGNVYGNNSAISALSSGAGLSVTTAAGTRLSGGTGIYAHNQGTGALTILANGNVTGTIGRAIVAHNDSTGTDLSVTTGTGTTVSGSTRGIDARNYGSGTLTVTANGVVTGNYAIYARNFSGTGLTVTTADTVTGVGRGIYARNQGSGALSITTTGNVTANGYGIVARNFGTGLTINTGAGTTVRGSVSAIDANNQGSGALTITANGNVTAFDTGIRAGNFGTDLSVTTAAGTTVSGRNGMRLDNLGSGALTITANGNVTATTGYGIFAQNYSAGTSFTVTTASGTTVRGGHGMVLGNRGTGTLSVTANGDVTGTTGYGIFANSNSSGLTVTTAAGTTVSGDRSGIHARATGTGTLTIAANGNVTGGSDGIYARSFGGAISIGVAATSTVSSTGAAAIETGGAAATVTVAGTLNGGADGAIKFDQTDFFNDRLQLITGATINGNVLGGLGSDTLGLSGTGSGSFNVAQLNSFETGDKTGSGTWTLTGTNASITAFSVDAGALIVNGSLSNAVFTVTGGTLGGIGTVGNTSIGAGAVFAPGSGTAGTSMTVNGTLGLNAASTYRVDINPSTASFANVSGAATLGGAAVNAIFANGSYIQKQYMILTVGSVSGTFNPTVTNTNLPANFHDTLSYDATHAYLNLILNFSTPASGTLNGNQNNVANALINFFDTTGGIPLAFAMLSAPSLSQAAGEPGADVAQTGFTGINQFINAIFDSAFEDKNGPGALGFAAGEGVAANAYAPKSKVATEAGDAFAKAMPVKAVVPSFAARWAVWATAYGGNSRVSGDATAGTNTTTSRIFGAAVGATYRFTPDTQAGFALGGAGSSFNLGFGGGKADVLNAALYAKHTFGPAYVAGLVGYSWQDTTTDRTVTIAGTDTLHAAFKAQALTARLEGGWRYATPMLGITPYGALQSTTFYLPGYGETATSGVGTFALNYASKAITATRGELGAKFDKAMLVQGGTFTLKAKTAWAHDWNTDRAATATFQALPGATFTVNGAQPSANAALVSLGADMKWHNGWTLAASVDSEFSRTTASYAGKGSVKYAW